MSQHASLPHPRRGLINRLLIGAVFGIAVIALFFVWGDIRAVKATVGAMQWRYFGLAIVLTLMSYGLRFGKWHWFLHRLRIKLYLKHSFAIFMAGLAMSITPGKVGELLKAHMIKNVTGTEISRSASAVLMDRLTDLIAMLLLIAISMTAVVLSPLALASMGLLLFTVIVVLQFRPLCAVLIQGMTTIRVLRRFRESLLLLYEGIYELLRWPIFLSSTLVSTAAWFLECIALFILLQGLGVQLPLLDSTFAFALSTVAGALSMLPGGLGVAEGSMTALLIYFDIDRAAAVTATLLIRLVTLWLGVFAGLLIFFKTWRRYMG